MYIHRFINMYIQSLSQRPISQRWALRSEDLNWEKTGSIVLRIGPPVKRVFSEGGSPEGPLISNKFIFEVLAGAIFIRDSWVLAERISLPETNMLFIKYSFSNLWRLIGKR